MRSETSEDMHEAQPYEEESPVDALKKAEDFLVGAPVGRVPVPYQVGLTGLRINNIWTGPPHYYKGPVAGPGLTSLGPLSGQS
ncbi:hypothetical protein H5410_028455 [Solanum commersonii]|uniref:Uncharacterized protein n=1 Tax=Solanum commersonii TaxID=4109 RepID=A0A9J5Z204_SOLCO|nr:hypothetical protein H5410_028455 [Solanum commersonii]